MRAPLSRIGISSRLALMFTVLVAVGFYTVVTAIEVFGRYDGMARLVDEAGRIRALSQGIAHSAHQFVTDRHVARHEIAERVSSFDQYIARLQPRLQEKTALADRFEQLSDQWRQYRRAVETLIQSDQKPEDLRELLVDIDNEAAHLLVIAEDIVQQLLTQHSEESRQVSYRFHNLMLLALGLGLIAYWHIRKRIIEPVEQIAATARRFADGDLDARINYRSHDEMGSLVNTLDGMFDATRELIHRHRNDELLIKDSELRHRTLWETSTDAIIMMDIDNIIRYANPAVVQIFGYSTAELIGQHIAVLQPDRFRQAHCEGFARYIASGQRRLTWQAFELPALHKDGHEVPVEISFNHMRLSAGDYFAAFFRDISRRTAAQDALRLRDRAIESAGEGILISAATTPDHPTIYVNPALCEMTGYSAEELLGRNARFLLTDIQQPEVEGLRHLLREQRDGTEVLLCRRKDGQEFWNELSIAPVRDDSGQVTHTISIFKDVTERRQQEQELLRRAHQDTLTGLPNRTLVYDRLQQALAIAHRHGRQVGVLFIDLDNFKLINDSLGHDSGDRVLVETARRLEKCLREGDTVARLGGDEFVLLLSDIESETVIAYLAERVLAVTSQPIKVGTQELFISASVGVSVFPRDGTNAATLLKNADIAMYRAKEQGRGNFQVFTSEMQTRISLRLSLETDLRKALDNEQLVLHYQPQVSLITGRICGAEALIRWQHPQQGLISPAQFIPLAEETGLIVAIGEWVIDNACAYGKRIQNAGLPCVPIAVNLSARQFRQKNLTQIIEQSLRMHELSSMQLEVELTESLIMQDPDQTNRILGTFRELGLTISLDDFGTGYSSLSHLRRFPIDILKIDQSFVRDVTTNANDAAITATIIALAHNLQLKVIAEGVETREQLQYLCAHHCDEMQGYYFSRPVPADDFFTLLHTDQALPAGDIPAAAAANASA